MWNALADAILDTVLGYQTYNKLKNNVISLASARIQRELGGSRAVAVARVASAQDAVDWVDVEIDGTLLAGLTVRAKVEVRTANAGTSVTPKIRNITDSLDAVVGVASTSTTWGGANSFQTLTFTPVNGIKKYRLQLTPQNTTNDVFGIGSIEIFATA